MDFITRNCIIQFKMHRFVFAPCLSQRKLIDRAILSLIVLFLIVNSEHDSPTPLPLATVYLSHIFHFYGFHIGWYLYTDDVWMLH